ncbi:NAD(P)H-dependent oxidoreductase [Marinimicrobium sp. ABcell2]|uniref:NAD(P)H-dependent oxidoreductase n=1 Tax=Marinimicrobium sp. ABcell2 TaxID=3069751 RepID=UPI0027B0B64E|nr:NAD(P)H-dependent oxidoreductase [Marinimicrobium sp. ABcell2]MDQ2076791.1 NAD(P)H-dependent oxidoreductase [Marinimicrobium sp. ABcell2]
MPERILIIQGHPDNSEGHLCHALADAYAEGAQRAGRTVKHLDIAALDFPLLRSKQEWEHGSVPPALEEAQEAIEWAEHLVLVFPLWLGDMPAMVKGFLEQVARPSFAFNQEKSNPFARKRLIGRSARVVVTMGMPALVYRWYFRAHSIKALERNILGFVGFAPVDETLIGSAGLMKPDTAKKWLSKMRKLGEKGA